MVIDNGIMNGFETITRLGGYILLFSILSASISHFWFFPLAGKYIFLGILELTTGLHGLHDLWFFLSDTRTSRNVFLLLWGIVYYGTDKKRTWKGTLPSSVRFCKMHEHRCNSYSHAYFPVNGSKISYHQDHPGGHHLPW